MKRVNLNFGIDLAAFFALLMLISTGLLIEFRLPPGSGGHEPYGHGWRALERPTPVIWDMTRHQWGEIHFWIAVTFASLLVFHLMLHWKWIVATSKNFMPRVFKSTVLLWFIAMVGLLLIAAPLLSPKVQRIRQRPASTSKVDRGTASEAQTSAGTSIGNIEPDSAKLR
jgi:type IV secretory pathway TrbL component